MKTLGLTGSIATGKSTVLAMFGQLGAATFSSDEAVHALYAGEAAAAVEALFPGIVRDGAVDRADLARRLVADPAALAKLEAVVHPLVRQRLHRFAADAERAGYELVVLDVPLLFETGYDYGVDAVAVTTCSEAEQRRRALLRPGMSVEKLATILARQMPQAEKKAKADYVIDTEGGLEGTRLQVEAVMRDLTRRSS